MITLNVRVIPRARKTECAGFRDDVLVLIEFFSSSFDVSRRAVRIVSGDCGRLKRIAIEGVTRAQVPWSRTS